MNKPEKFKVNSNTEGAERYWKVRSNDKHREWQAYLDEVVAKERLDVWKVAREQYEPVTEAVASEGLGVEEIEEIYVELNKICENKPAELRSGYNACLSCPVTRTCKAIHEAQTKYKKELKLKSQLPSVGEVENKIRFYTGEFGVDETTVKALAAAIVKLWEKEEDGE